MKIWANKRYYQEIARRETFNHPGFLRAVELCKNAKKILDVGCGDGSKLKKLGNKKTKRFGCDVSPLAKDFGFDVFDGVCLPYKDNSFDRVISFFVLEHTEKPKELLADMVRVLEKDGLLILLAPNFGAPNRASPNFVGSRIKKLFFNPQWQKVRPKNLSMKNFESDLDTTLEPYLDTIIKYLSGLGLEVVKYNSFWNMELAGANPLQRIFRFLGEASIAPFNLLGPHLFVVARK